MGGLFNAQNYKVQLNTHSPVLWLALLGKVLREEGQWFSLFYVRLRHPTSRHPPSHFQLTASGYLISSVCMCMNKINVNATYADVLGRWWRQMPPFSCMDLMAINHRGRHTHPPSTHNSKKISNTLAAWSSILVLNPPIDSLSSRFRGAGGGPGTSRLGGANYKKHNVSTDTVWTH